MSVKGKYFTILSKLEKLCENNSLDFAFVPGDFPLVMSVTPDAYRDVQQKIKDDCDPVVIDARINSIFGEELQVKMLGDFTIDAALMNKIKNMATKLHYLFLQLWFIQQGQNEAAAS